MSFDVIVYRAHYNPKLDRVLRAFYLGIPKNVHRHLGDLRQPKPSRYAVIFGLVKKSYKPTHLKQRVIDLVGMDNVIVLESAFVQRKTYFTAGFGGIHGAADFKDAGKPLDRWNNMSVTVKEWQKRPKGYMLVCGQLPRDTNVQHMDHIAWCQDTVDYYRARNIPVLFRPHPRMENPLDYGVPAELLDTNKKITQSLQHARAVVTYTSTSGIDAMLQGVPVIAIGRDSMSACIASNSLDPDSLIYPDRKPLLVRIGYAQWTMRELLTGKAWEHLVGKSLGGK